MKLHYRKREKSNVTGPSQFFFSFFPFFFFLQSSSFSETGQLRGQCSFKSDFLTVKEQRKVASRAFITLFGILSRPLKKIHCCTSLALSHFFCIPAGTIMDKRGKEKGSKTARLSTSITPV